MTNVTIVFHSLTDHTTAMATRLAETARALGADVRLRPVHQEFPEKTNPAIEANKLALKGLTEATPEDLVWADVILFGVPTRFSNPSHEFLTFIDTLGGLWAEGKLANKVYAAFTSTQTLHGGQETTLQKIYQMVMHFGGFIVAPGFTDPIKFSDGNPYGVSHTTGPTNTDPLSEITLKALDHMVTRTIEVSKQFNS